MRDYPRARGRTRPCPPRRALPALAATLVLALAACGGGDDDGGGGTPAGGGGGGGGEASSGKQVFASAGCGGCHTLADAGADGSVGPNLDKVQPDEATVARQVTNGGGGMPKFGGSLSKAQITAVAQYVSGVAGR